MKRLLPADKKAIAMAAWLFYSERGFDAQLIHHQVNEDIELRVTYEDSQGLPECPMLYHTSFSATYTRVGYSDMVYSCIIPSAFL